jgi:hypothetical protein
VLFVIFVTPIVTSAVWPDIFANAMHVIVFPVTNKLATVWPFVNAVSVDFVVTPASIKA